MGLEEDKKKAEEEAMMQKAALTIQRRWRDYLQVKEDNEEMTNYRSGPYQEMLSGDDYGDEFDSYKAPLTAEERRQQLIDEYRRLLAEREEIIEQNISYQRIISRHLMEKRNRRSEDEVPITAEAEQQYWTLVRQLAEERKQVEAKKAATDEELDRLREGQEEIIMEGLMQEQNFREYIKELAAGAHYMRSNKPMRKEDVQKLLDQDEEQRTRIRERRVRLLKLQNFVKKIQQAMEEKDKRSRHTGMYLIDFEQLKIENTNLSEKIEERNEDISKLRRKVTTTIHVLTHMKEKLEFMQNENGVLQQQVASTEEELSVIRDQLAQTKRRRDGYAASNVRMKEKMPLVGSEDLLLDYENRKEAINRARMKVVQLTDKHKELTEFIQRNQPVMDDLQRALSNYPK